MRRLVAALVVLACTACEARSVTEIVVVVRTTFPVPGALDGVRIDVTGPGGQTMVASGAWLDAAEPRMLGLVHDGGALGPLLVNVDGLLGAAVVAERDAELAFVAGEVRVLEIWLSPNCVGVGCGGRETCDRGACRGVEVSPSELGVWSGIPTLDAGAPDAALTRDGGLGADGGLGVDGGLTSDGGLGTDGGLTSDGGLPSDGTPACCPPRVAGAAELTCAGADCMIVRCDAGLADCDRAAATGCEARLDMSPNCGACDVRCNGGRMCVAEAGSFVCR